MPWFDPRGEGLARDRDRERRRREVAEGAGMLRGERYGARRSWNSARTSVDVAPSSRCGSRVHRSRRSTRRELRVEVGGGRPRPSRGRRASRAPRSTLARRAPRARRVRAAGSRTSISSGSGSNRNARTRAEYSGGCAPHGQSSTEPSRRYRRGVPRRGSLDRRSEGAAGVTPVTAGPDAGASVPRVYGRVVGSRCSASAGTPSRSRRSSGVGCLARVHRSSGRRGQRCARPGPPGGGERGARVAAAPRGGEPRPREPPQGGAGLDLPVAVGVLAATAQVPAHAVIGLRVRGRAVAQGRAPADAGHPVGRHRRRSRGPRRRRRAGGERARGRADRRRSGSWAPTTLAEVAGSSAGTWTARGRSAGVGRAGRSLEGRPRGGARPGTGPTGARGGGGGRAQPAHGGSARRRQDHARASARHDPAGSSHARRRSRPRSCTRSPGCSRAGACSRPGRSGRRTTRSRSRVSSAAAPAFLRPGEVSLAHHGVLFLDEFTEFRRDAVEGLRQPLEDGRVVVTRAAGSVEFPARFTLVAAANPCPCGFDGDQRKHCRCRVDRVELYQQKLSGPLLDRIDLRLRVPRLTKQELMGSEHGERSRRGPRSRPGGARTTAASLRVDRRRAATRICRARWSGATHASAPGPRNSSPRRWSRSPSPGAGSTAR